MHANGAPVIRLRRPADRRSRIQRWNDTIAAAAVGYLEVEYADWLDALPDNQQDSALAEALQGDCRNSICPSSRRSSRHADLAETEQRDGPRHGSYDDAWGELPASAGGRWNHASMPG